MKSLAVDMCAASPQSALMVRCTFCKFRATHHAHALYHAFRLCSHHLHNASAVNCCFAAVLLAWEVLSQQAVLSPHHCHCHSSQAPASCRHIASPNITEPAAVGQPKVIASCFDVSSESTARMQAGNLMLIHFPKYGDPLQFKKPKKASVVVQRTFRPVPSAAADKGAAAVSCLKCFCPAASPSGKSPLRFWPLPVS